MFSKYHYLSHSHHNAATVYLAFVNEKLAGFISVQHFPHPRVKTFKKVHRLVVLPDYQGLGLGIKLLNEIGMLYKKDGFRYSIITSAPSLINSLKSDAGWICRSFGRQKPVSSTTNVHGLIANNSAVRLTASFELM